MAKILAIVTTAHQGINNGGVPTFNVNNKEEFEEISLKLEKILNATAHLLDGETMIIVEHHNE
ncbi:hypothetical protein ACFFIS_00865 [Virgibacillus soli]|uniref:Uncharacterized protein n=1 Tax=Paracerasibacillus soli TaxID=480284 RepID=A0ABU5CR63_9BACI|nr:hypothetical protein [Virgibacillus soli]MDY0408356.1 hypothetical protein [Virgibacillus soli]